MMARVRKSADVSGTITVTTSPLTSTVLVDVSVTSVGRSSDSPGRVERYGDDLRLIVGPGPAITRSRFGLEFVSIRDAHRFAALSGTHTVVVRSGEGDWAFGLIDVTGQRVGGFIGEWRTMSIAITELVQG